MWMKLKKILLYAGVEKEKYNLVIPDINRANRMMITVFSGLAIVLISMMVFSSLVFNSMSQNRFVYIAGLFASLLLFLTSFYFSKRNSKLVVYMVYVSYIIFFAYGIFIGVITNPSQQAVTFMIMLVFLPMLFIDRPIRSTFAVFVFVAIFIVFSMKRKTGDVLTIDVLNSIIYGILGTVSGCVITHIKVRSYVLEHQLHDACRFDQLTKMNNRNSFESELSSYPAKCRDNLACIYIDVNGLHDLNNSQGHLFGDVMLQSIAEKTREIFGAETTYRIGGDEFVAFAIDLEKKTLQKSIQRLRENIESEGYHDAIGCECMGKDKIAMEMLIKSAETAMYRSKSEYYKRIDYERSSRD